MTDPEAGGLAGGWLRDLRAGSTRTWREWRAADPRPGDPSPAYGAQLEVVRLLALRHAAVAMPGFAELADLVAETPAAGRGRVDPPLEYPAGADGVSVQPDELPPDELLRVAVPVLTRLLERLPDAPLPGEPAGGGLLARRFRLHGAPGSASAVRRTLLAGGLRPSDFRSTHVVLTGPLEAVMYQHWATRIGNGGGVGWQRFWALCEANDRVPPRLALPALLERLRTARPEPRSVQVIVATTADEAARAAGGLFGVRAQRAEPLRPPSDVDVQRRVNQLLMVGAAPAHALRLRERFAELMARLPTDEPRLLVAPPRHRPWIADMGGRLAAAAAAGGYPVHGDPQAIGRPIGAEGLASGVGAGRSLARALDAIDLAWRRCGEERH